MCMFICCSCPSPVWWTRQAISLFHPLHLLSGGSAFSQALPRVLYWLLCFQLAKRQKRKWETKKTSGASHLHIPICQNSGTWPQSNCTGSWNMKCSSIQKEKNSIGGHLNNLCQALHYIKTIVQTQNVCLLVLVSPMSAMGTGHQEDASWGKVGVALNLS